MPKSLVTRAQTKDDKWSYLTKLEMGYCVQDLTPFRKAIGISKSLISGVRFDS